METKQTAVEWLISQVEDFYCLLPVDMIEQAKQMEKEQIKDAYEAGEENAMDCHSIPNFKDMTADEYYNETYGKQNIR
jgi:hypothetical protein